MTMTQSQDPAMTTREALDVLVIVLLVYALWRHSKRRM